MNIERTTVGINKAADGGKMDAQIRSAKALQRAFPTTVASYVSWFGSPGGNREPAGPIVVWQMCYPVQHVLDAAACTASSATFWKILLRAVSGCCYNNDGLRNRRWANAITKHGGKGEWQTSGTSLPLNLPAHSQSNATNWETGYLSGTAAAGPADWHSHPAPKLRLSPTR